MNEDYKMDKEEFLRISPKLQQYFSQSFVHLVKTNCCACGAFIDPDYKRYMEIGNFCSTCNTGVMMGLQRVGNTNNSGGDE